MQQGRRYRSQQTFVRDWGTFLKVKKNFDLKKLEPMTIQQRTQQIRARFNEFIEDQQFQCFIFPDKLKPEHLKLFIQVVSTKQFSQTLDYEHQGFYLDNPKQLVIFKRRASVATYLAKYRPCDKFKNLLGSLTQISKQYRKLVIQRNIKISQQCSKEQVEAISKELNSFYDQKMEPRLVEWRVIVLRMLKDFKNQPKKQQFLFLGVNSYLTQEIKNLVKDQQLYISNRYEKISPYDQYRDILVTKYDRSEPSQTFDDKSLSDEQSLEQEKVQQKEKKQFILKEPKQIDNVSYKQKNEDGVVCFVNIPSFGKANCIDFILIRLSSPKQNEWQKKYQQRINVQHDKLCYQVTLPCLHTGCSTFQFITINSVGECKNPFMFKVWMQGVKGSQNNQGIMKLNYVDNPLYIMGENQYGLIPNQQQQSGSIIRTTFQKWQKLKFLCNDFSVSSHGVICNRKGQVASWGYMHFFDSEGLNQDQKKQDDETDQIQDYLGKLSSQYFRVQSPSLVLEGQCIRKVSCGEGYCLMVDSLGGAWSFGLNNFGQLGLEHTDENESTQDPTKIKFFRIQKIFITDVIASYYGASFAIDDKGQAYRWGTNQVDQSNKPVLDSYNNVINFEFPDIIAAQSLPILIGKKLITEKILSIHPGNHFAFALTQNNNVYGWGKTKFLGNGEIQNAHFENIQNICNPIPVLKNVIKLSIGKSHCLAKKDDGSLVAWGESEFYKNNKKQFVKKPQIIRQSYTGDFVCGPNFTAYLQQDMLIVQGNEKIFKKKKYQLPGKVLKLKAGQGVLMMVGQNKIPIQQAQEKKIQQINLIQNKQGKQRQQRQQKKQ